MDFKLSEEQLDIKKAVQKFTKGEFTKEKAMEFDVKEEFPFDLWKKACKLGFMGVRLPEEYGGQGLGMLEGVLIIEELCRADSSLGAAITLATFGYGLILKYGTEEQKKKYLTPLTRGEAISAGAFTEPEHGSDITFLSTRAVKDGEEYVVNGTKTLITNGDIADFIVVLCQTNPEAKPSYRGQSLLMVERDSKGFKSTKIKSKLGIRASSTAELSFTDVRVPVTNLVGEENKGFYHTLEHFDESRVEVAAQAVGIAQGAFDRALNYAKQRKQFGQRLVDMPVIQHKLADMSIKIETARLLLYKAAWSIDKKEIDPVLSSMAKCYAGRVAVEVTDETVQILGGYGYIAEQEVERFYRDAKITEIYEGTREIQKNTIARFLIKR